MGDRREASGDGRHALESRVGGERRSGGRLGARVRAVLAARFGIDARALAALRVALGLLLLADLAFRSGDLVAFYTDAGVLPRRALERAFPTFAHTSLHALSGAAWYEAALFVLAGVVALSLLVGYRTRLATLVSLVLLVSLQARNPLVLNAGDALLRRLLLWGVFLPLGARWSVDARRREGATDHVLSLASAALLLQVVLVYTVNAAFKLQGTAWLDGTAIRYVFGLDQLTVLFGDALAHVPVLLVALDRLWLAMVVGSVLLVVLTGWRRAAFVAAFVLAHLGMALTMRLGLFPFVSIAALLPFLPASTWDRVAARWSGLAGRVASRDPVGWLDRSMPGGPDWPTPPALGAIARRGGPTVVAVLLAVVLVWNAATLGLLALPAGVTSSVDPGQYRWDMFAPEPRHVDGWYVVPGELESGRHVDAFHGGPVTWARPSDLATTFPSHGWFLYLLNLQRPGYADLRPAFGRYLCRRWNRRHDDDLASVTVDYVAVPVRLDGPGHRHREELLQYRCPAG